jgi:molecular chaperone DnaJ
MERRLADEARREVFTLVMKDTGRIKAELALIRERTVAIQGYDSFREAIVFARGAEVLAELLGAEAEARMGKLVTVALKILIAQGAVKGEDERAVREMAEHLRDTCRRGRLAGFRDALELFYVRR